MAVKCHDSHVGLLLYFTTELIATALHQPAACSISSCQAFPDEVWLGAGFEDEQ